MDFLPELDELVQKPFSLFGLMIPKVYWDWFENNQRQDSNLPLNSETDIIVNLTTFEPELRSKI